MEWNEIETTSPDVDKQTFGIFGLASEVLEVMDGDGKTGYGIYQGEHEWELDIKSFLNLGEIKKWRPQNEYDSMDEVNHIKFGA